VRPARAGCTLAAEEALLTSLSIAAERALLLVLAPLWAFCWLSTVGSLERNTVVVPFFVEAAGAPQALPVVTGFPSWTLAAAQPEPALAVGDRVVAIAGESLAGAGPERVVGLAWASMGNDGKLELLVEREGRRLEAGVAIPASVPKWPVLPVSLAFAAMAFVGALRAPRWPAMRAAWPAFLATAFWLGAQFGRTPGELLLAFWIRAAALVAVQPLYVRLLRFFPTGSDAGVRWARGWPWLLGVNGLVVVDMELYGRLPLLVRDLVPKLAALVFGALLLALGTLNYRRAGPADRRRFKWLLLGTWVGIVPPAIVSTLSALRPELGRFFLPSQLAQLAIPLSIGIGQWRNRLWDIDRLLNAGVVYLAAAGAFVVAFVGAAGWSRALLAGGAGLSPESADLAFALALVGVLLPAALAARAALDRVVLREQRAREREVEVLLPAVGRCAKLEEIAALLALRLPALFGARGCLVLADAGAGLVPVHASTQAPEPTPAECSLLAGAAEPQDLAQGIGVPVRDALAGATLGAVVLGPKPAGDDYTMADRKLLRRLSDHVALAVRGLRQEERLAAVRRMAAGVAAARDRAERASHEKTQLLATASHDLRQPLLALGLLVDALERRVDGDEARALLRQVRASAQSVERRFGTLLDVARLESGALVPEVEEGVALAPLFDELRATVGPLAQEKGLELDVRATPEVVRSDPVLLRSILENLLVNAVRYTETGGVLLSAHRRADRVHVEVRDSGPGIAPEQRERLFSAWQRGEADATGGVGLGLAIVRRLVDLLGHGLELHSSPGRGSLFVLALQPGTPPPPVGAELSGARAIVIDDEDAARAALVAALAALGLEVTAARDAADALEVWGQGPPPDLALVDLALAGGATGPRALAELEARFGPLPAAFVTGATAGALLDEARASGRPVLRKPLAAVQLRALLQHLLRQRGEVGVPAARTPDPERG
jgi:signal transduction histidine kinase/CheY-like chemotaxis protein